MEFNKTIYIVGPSSTGKTTLCNALAKKLNLSGPAVVAEVARHVMKTQGYTRHNVGSLEMQRAIMVAHMNQEEEGRSCPIQVCDRSAVDPIVYAVMTSKDEDEARSRQNDLVNSPGFRQALEKYRNTIFVLLAPVAEWVVDDGVRLTENQESCFEVFKTVLVELGITFREFGPQMKFLEERVLSVMGLMRL